MKDLFLQSWSVGLPYAIVVGILAGTMLGFAHFLTLKWNTGLYLEGGVAKAIVLHILRMIVLAAAFIILAKLGAAALLSGLAGLLLARAIVMRREKRAG